jgi:TolB-like protein/DNA-binding winged helix-turn-helix (wHTH) protein/Tfp pilus assembly protein PilF
MRLPAEFLLGEFRVNPALDEISRGGITTKLEPRTMRLLVCLAERAGQVVSVEQLLNLVWKDVIVSPDSVYQVVASLRRILGDDPKGPKYIANVARRGYRLVAAIQLPTTVAVAPEIPSRPPEPKVGKFAAFAICAAAVILFALLAVQVGWQRKSGLAAVEVVAPLSQADNDKSVAVLPFLDMSEKKDQEYFADGMSEELITALSRVPVLRIPARTSSFYFKGKQAAIPEIAKSLGVQYVLEGSVRKSGATLRTTVQLIRARDGIHLWSQTYDRDLSDVLKVQDEIATAVVKSLELTILSGSIPSVPRTVDPAAYSLYLEARFLEQRDASGDYAPAVEYLQKALEMDPGFALGWAELALVHVAFFETFTRVSADTIRRDAEHAANRALQLDPNLPEAHLALARILSHIDWNWSGAKEEYNRVLRSDPANSDALLGLSKVAAIEGRLDEALELCQRVIARDPLNYLAYFSLAALESRRGNYAQAEAGRRKVIELNPTGATVHFWLGYSLLAEGKASEALEEMQKEDDATTRRSGAMLALDALGRTGEAERLVVLQKQHSAEAAANIAAFYACRRDTDRAFVWLEKAYVQRDYYITNIDGDFCFKNLRADWRYKPFLRKMGLAEERP